MGILVGTQARIVYVAEVTRGVTPGTTGKLLRGTNKNINLKRDTLESAEVSSSRQRSDVRHGFGRIDGPLNFELSMTTYDDWLAYAMARPNTNLTPALNASVTSYSGWVQASKRDNVQVPTGIVAATATTPGEIPFRIANTGVNTNWVDLGYRPGDYVCVDGFANENFNSARNADGTANSGALGPSQWRVIRITANESGTNSNLWCEIPTGMTGVSGTETAEVGQFVDYAGRRVSIGTTLTTMSLERGFIDGVNNVFQLYPGCGIQSMSLDVRPDQIVGGTFNMIGGLAGIGLTPTDIDNSVSQFSTVNAASTNSPFAAFDGQVTFVNNIGTAFSGTVTQLSFTLDNQRSLLPVVGQRFSGDLYEGVAKVTGTVSILLDSRLHLTYFQDESALTTMVVRLNELGTNDFMSLTFNRVKYLSADIDPPQNGPCIVTIPFEALEQAFTGFSASTIVSREAFRIQRSTGYVVPV